MSGASQWDASAGRTDAMKSRGQKSSRVLLVCSRFTCARTFPSQIPASSCMHSAVNFNQTFSCCCAQHSSRWINNIQLLFFFAIIYCLPRPLTLYYFYVTLHFSANSACFCLPPDPMTMTFYLCSIEFQRLARCRKQGSRDLRSMTTLSRTRGKGGPATFYPTLEPKVSNIIPQ